MKLSLSAIPSFSLKNDSVSDIASILDKSAGAYGAIVVKDLPRAPLATNIAKLMQALDKRHDLAKRLNQAYANNMVYKDSFKAGKGGPSVDRKRVLDLSPERLETIALEDPELLTSGNLDLAKTLVFWKTLDETASGKLSQALALAIGSDDALKDVHGNYRMVEYYPVDVGAADAHEEAPRCGEHRDFGSFTLIYTSHPGLQIYHQGEWMDVEHDEAETTAVLLFGWCTQIRSNGRIPAALHRVVMDNDKVERRISAVLFVAPKHSETRLTPVVRPGEEPLYIPEGVLVGQLRGNMARKWQSREGTLSPENTILEEEEIRMTKRLTQDDVVRDLVGTTAVI